MKNVLIAVCLSLFSTLSFSQAINERWIGTWKLDIPGSKPMVITQSTFNGCLWVNKPTQPNGKCLAFYNGSTTKKSMVQNFSSDQSRAIPSLYGDKYKNSILLTKKNLNQISDDTFKTIIVTGTRPYYGSTSFIPSYFLDKEFIYENLGEDEGGVVSIQLIQYQKIN
jgi:hypothetical protein